MADAVVRLRIQFEDREARAGLERFKKQTIKIKESLKKLGVEGSKAVKVVRKLGIEGDKAGKKIKGSMQGGAFAIRGIATEMESALRGLVIAMTAVTAAGGLLARQAVNMSAEFEVLKITFESLTGSITQADQLIREMKEFAVRTPLQLRDVEEAGTILLAFGERAADVIPILDLLGQAAVAMNKPLEQFIRVRNLLGQGVVLSRMLAPLGISRDILRQFGAGAEATGEELVAAFDKALGRFEGLFERTFDTVRGRMSNLKDELDVMFAAIGDTLREPIIKFVGDISDILTRIRTFFEKNKELIESSVIRIREAVETYLHPVITLLTRFLNDLERHPENIRIITENFIRLSKAMVNLLIVGTIATGFLKLVAAITLLRLSLPQLLFTLGITTKGLSGFGIAATGATTAVTGFQLALTRFVSFIPIAIGVIGALGAAYIGLSDAISRSNAAMAQRSFRVIPPDRPAVNLGFAEKLGLDFWSTLFPGVPEGNAQAALDFLGTLRGGPGGGVTPQLAQFLAQGGIDYLRGLLPDAPTPPGGDGAGAAPVNKFADAIAKFRAEILATSERLRLNLINDRERQEGITDAKSDLIDSLIKIRSEIGLAIDQQNLLNILTKDYINILKPQELRDAQALWIENLKIGADEWAANMEEWNRLQDEDLNLQRQREFARFRVRQDPLFRSGLFDFDTTASEGLLFRVIDPLRDLTKKIEKTSNEFIGALARELGDFLAQLGKTGGKADIGGFVSNLIGIGANAVGASLFGRAKTKAGFARGGLFAEGAFLGGLGPGLVAGAITGGLGFIANRLIGEEPLKIEQPVDIRIVDIETRLKNFFNFRGLDPFTFRSSFQEAFENGVY